MFHISLGSKTLFCGGKHLNNVVCQDCFGGLSLLNDVSVTTGSRDSELFLMKGVLKKKRQSSEFFFFNKHLRMHTLSFTELTCHEVRNS